MPKRGRPKPGPIVRRRRVNQPQLLQAVYATRKPIWRLALEAGFLYTTPFSKLIHAEEVPDTDFNITGLERIAEVVGFDRSRLFLDAGR